MLTRMPKQIYYGNFVTQGLPFYAGNLTYETEIETEEGVLWVETSHYRGALLQVTVDGSYKRNLILHHIESIAEKYLKVDIPFK